MTEGGGLSQRLYCDTARCRATTRHAGRWAGDRLGARGSRVACGARAWRAGLAGGSARARGTRAWRAERALGARPVRSGWAKLVHCAPGSVLTQFLTKF